jgi:hypothetical protein
MWRTSTDEETPCGKGGESTKGLKLLCLDREERLFFI